MNHGQRGGERETRERENIRVRVSECFCRLAGLGQALIAKYNTLRIECGKRLTNLHPVVDIGNGRATGSMDREGAREK